MFNMFKKSFTKAQQPVIVENEIAATIDTSKEEDKKFISGEKVNKMFSRASKMIDEYLQEDVVELFSEAPLYLKIKFVLHAFNIANAKDSEIDWTRINEFIHSNPIPYDYNIDLPGVIISIDDLKYLDSIMFMALKDVKPYYRSKCKICDNDFDLKYGEIKFYINNNLYVTKKCVNCRKSK